MVASLDSADKPKRDSLLIQAVITIAVGVASGLGGMLLGLLLHWVQHVAYGYRLDGASFHENFLYGVTHAAPLRRLEALCVCGLVAGCGWFALYRFGRPLVSIAKAVKEESATMPLASTIWHGLLQIVTVGLGSPLGREVAPRELGAVIATYLCKLARMSDPRSRVLIACGAGAGLAAVYNVPLGGALFTLEVLLGTFSLSALIPALATSVLASVVAWIGLGNIKQYSLPNLSISPSLIVWATVMGPLLGLAAYWFSRVMQTARMHAPRDWRILLWCILVFPGIGLLAMKFPELLGNGKAPIQLGLNSELTVGAACVLLALKLLVIGMALRAGAGGGLLTPGMAMGALISIVTGGLWNLVAPAVPYGAFAVIGATAFLASSMKMPLTAIVLGLEFTGIGYDFLIPIGVAVVGSRAVSYLCERSQQTAEVPGHSSVATLQTEQVQSFHSEL